jgi:hypothetical protein
MVELGVDDYEGIESFKGAKKMLGSKPVVVFSGEEWHSAPDFQRLKSVLLGTRRWTSVLLCDYGLR